MAASHAPRFIIEVKDNGKWTRSIADRNPYFDRAEADVALASIQRAYPGLVYRLRRK